MSFLLFKGECSLHKNGIEYIKVHIDYQDGRTICVCKASHKLCDKNCDTDIVERDIYRGWQKAFQVDKYGKSKL